MGATYSVYLFSPTGTQLAIVDEWFELSYTRVVNGVGGVRLELADRYDLKRLLYEFDVYNQPDARIQVWRSISGGLKYLETDTVFLIDRLQRRMSADGARTIVIGGVDANDLLRRRIIAYAAGSAQAAQTDQADDMLKQIVRQNLGASATDTTRDLSAYLSVQADFALGPSISKQFAWRNELIKVLQEICNTSASPAVSTPTYLAFDVVWTGSAFEFRTYTTVRDVDHRFPSGTNPLILSPASGALTDINLEYDYAREWTRAIAGGQGEGSARATETANDTTRQGKSPFRLIEHFKDARNVSTVAGLQAEAYADLRAGRPRKTFTAKLQQTPALQYGLHYRLGSILTANYINQQFNVRVDRVSVAVRNGEEQIDVSLRGDELL